MKAYNFQKQTIFFRNIAQVLNFGLEPLVIGFERCSHQRGGFACKKNTPCSTLFCREKELWKLKKRDTL